MMTLCYVVYPEFILDHSHLSLGKGGKYHFIVCWSWVLIHRKRTLIGYGHVFIQDSSHASYEYRLRFGVAYSQILTTNIQILLLSCFQKEIKWIDVGKN
jgi:hypothetical protein